MPKNGRNSIFFGLNYETQRNYFIYGLNSIPDFFLNYWSKKDRLSCEVSHYTDYCHLTFI